MAHTHSMSAAAQNRASYNIHDRLVLMNLPINVSDLVKVQCEAGVSAYPMIAASRTAAACWSSSSL